MHFFTNFKFIDLLALLWIPSTNKKIVMNHRKASFKIPLTVTIKNN